MSIAVALDLLVAGLLVATIAYAIVLNRRLTQLRDGSAQMERLINDFYQATTRAESGVTALKEVTGRGDTGIIEQLESLSILRDELEFLVARAEAQGVRLEDLIRDSSGPTAKVSPDTATDLALGTGLDAKLFGDPEVTPGSGSRPQPKPTSSAAALTPNWSALQELR